MPLDQNSLPSPVQSNDGPVMEVGANYAYAGLPPSQGPPVLDDGRMGFLLSDVLLHTYYPQVNAEARNHILCDSLLIVKTNTDIQAYIDGLFSSLQPAIQGMSEAWTPYDDGHPFLPVRELFRSTRIPLSDLMFVKLTLTGHEVVPHASIGDSAHANIAEVDVIHNSGQHSVSTSAPLDQGHLYTHSGTGPNFSPPSRRSTGARKAPNKSYSCAICDEEYAQMQGVRRHIRTKHRPSSCLFCDFKWGRPENYRNHLTKRHDLGVAVVDEILGKPAGSRRSTTIIGRDPPQIVSSLAIERATGTA